MQIRTASESEIPVFHQAFDRIWPNHLGLAELRRDLALMLDKTQMTLWVVENDQEVVGVARAYRLLGAYHPQKWFFEMGIVEEHRQKGLGRKLYDHVLVFVQKHGAIQLAARTRDDDSWSLRFMTDRGFVETKRDFESVLDLKDLRPSILDAMDNSSFDIRAAKDVDSDDFRHSWHRLFEDVRKDIPRDEPPTPLTFEEFSEIFLQDQEFLWEVSMFAFAEGELIGFTLTLEIDGRGVLYQALTAVRKDYRGMGLAKALKARAMRMAMEKGFSEVHADSDTRNTVMIAINNRLGYQPKPSIIWLRKPLT